MARNTKIFVGCTGLALACVVYLFLVRSRPEPKPLAAQQLAAQAQPTPLESVSGSTPGPVPSSPAASSGSSTSPVLSTAPSTQPPAVVAEPMLREEKLPTTYTEPRTTADLPSEKEQSDFLKGRVIAERSSPPDAQGRFVRVRLVETKSKYPVTRVEETWQKDPAAAADTPAKLEKQVAMAADHLITKLRPGKDTAALEAYLQQIGGSIQRVVPNSQVHIVKVPEIGLDQYEVLAQKLREAGSPVEYVEPDFVVHAMFTPNDPSYAALWGMNNSGQTGGTSDADIDAPEAWDVARGSSSVVVGIIDTGIDYTHPDLAANMWLNTREIPGNGIDDDGNGYIDDVRGWDFVNNDNNPMDDHYHGTHCAGTIGAVGNNGIGVAGVCHTVRLMPLKFLSASGSGYTSDAVEAVSYATANGATLTSNSWGGGGYSQALKDAIDAAQAAGVLFVAAAGNNSSSNDNLPSYPASYNSANIIAVAATDHTDKLAYFSNYGANTVHLAAPGVSIYSTAPNAGYQSLSGTSMACPHVAGACALLKSARSDITATEIKAALLANVDGIAGLNGKVQTGGRLNIARTLLISTGPFVTMTNIKALDDPVSGGVGNSDGILNPGEDVVVPVTIKNVGGAAAPNLSSQLTVQAGGQFVSILQGTQVWGSLASGGSGSNSATPFKVRIAATAGTPAPFTLRLTTTDGTGRTWTSDADFTVYTSSTIDGKVVALTGSTPIANATVTCTGSATATAVTASDGTYRLSVIDGNYSIRVAAAGYNTSDPVAVTVPPSRTNVNFALGRSRLQVTPQSLASTQNEDQIVQKTLTLSNTGDLPLNVSLSASSITAASFDQGQLALSSLGQLGASGPDEHAKAPPATSALAGTPTPLPFYDGFEGGTLNGWYEDGGSGTREIASGTAASGSKSFHFLYTGPTGHFTGIHRGFSAGSRPKYVSFWVRSSSTATSDGYFVLTDGGADAIWFFAKSTGNFYVNADNGGDETVPYQANLWYHIEFRDIDWAAKNFDYYVGGLLVKANVPFRNGSAVTQFTEAYLYNFSPNSEAWWDDVRISNDAVNWLSGAPSSLTLAPGQNATVTVSLNATDLIAGTYRANLDLYSNDPANPATSVPVTMTVQAAPNTPPVANPQTVVLNEDTSAMVTLAGSDADGNPLTAVVTQLPSSGALYQTSDGTQLGAPITTVPTTVTNPSWKLIYVPAANAFGTPLTTFQFVLKDKRSQSNAATVTLNVTSVNDVPLALNDSASGLPGQGFPSIAVLANDSDADNDPLTITSFTQGARGAVASNGNGTLRYTPGGSFTQGFDSFTYTVSDGRGGTATAAVLINIGYLTAGPWPMFGNGPAHTGYYPAQLGGQTFAPNWTLAFDRTLNHTAIADGKVFVTRDIYSNETYVTAVDLATGTFAWRHDFASANSITGPSYNQGRIYLQRGNHSTDSQLWSLDAQNGATVWSAPFSAQWESYLQPTVTDTSVFVNGGYYGGLYGFNRTNGSQLFFQQLAQEDMWTPTVGSSAVFSCVYGALISHDPTTGAKNWTYNIDSSWYDAKTTAYEGGKIFVAGSSGLYAVNVSGTPSQAWRATGNFTGSPAVANGRVYAITTSGYKVQAFDTTTGALLGDYLTGSEYAQSQPIVTNDCLIVAGDSQTFIFNLSTRALLQTINYGGFISLSNGVLIIAGYDGVLRAYTVSGAANHTPVALAQTATGVEDQTVTITLTGSDVDGDFLTPLISSVPSRGSLYQTPDGVQIGELIATIPVLVKNPQGKVIYRPAPDGFGSAYANFNFKVNDGVINSAEAAVTVNITGVNDAPVAMDDKAYLRSGNTLESYWPTANDIDADGDTLEITTFTQPAHGTVTKNGDGSLRYVPATDFIDGTDTFQYTVRDAAQVTSAATVSVIVSDTLGQEWPTFGGGPDHTGRYPGSLGTTALVQRWQFGTGVAMSSLAVAEGKVFYAETGNFNNYVSAAALDSVSGTEVWRQQFDPSFSLNPPAYFKNTVYLQQIASSGSNGAKIWALNSSDGSVKWQTILAAQWERYLSPAVSDLGVFVNSGTYGGIAGLDKDTGAQKFALGLEQVDGWTPSLDSSGLYSFVNGKFRRHNTTSGVIDWVLDLGWYSAGSMNRTSVLDNGRAYVVNNRSGGNELVAIDLTARTVLWRTSAQFTGTPAVVGGIVYALSGGTVKTFGASAGIPFGDYPAPNETALVTAPVVTGDLVIAASASKTYIFDRVTRALLQTLNFGSQIAIADDVIYLACSDYTVRAFGAPKPGNRPPVANGAQVGIVEEAAVTIQLEGADADGDALRFAIRSLPTQGTLYQTTDGVNRGEAITRVPTLVRHSSGRVIYQAPLDVTGPNVGAFTFSASDRYSTSVAATVRIDITPVNDAPTGIADRVALRPGQSLASFRPESNDRDADGDPLTVVAFTQGTRGRVVQNADGSLSYVPDAGFTSGTDSYTYTVRDAGGLETTATVAVVVSATLGREWPTFGAGPDHTGYLPTQLGAATFTEQWTKNIGKVPLALAVAGGRVFAAQQTYFTASSLLALDASSGGEAWRVNFTGGAYMNPPTAFGGDVFMQYSNSSSSRLYAIAAPSGAAHWSSSFAAQWEQYLAPAIDAAGVFINGGYYGGLYGFDTNGGSQLFFQSLEQYDDWTPTLFNGGLYTFVKGTFRSHDRTTGAILWSLAFGWDGFEMNRTIACADNRAFLVNDSVTIPSGSQDLVAVDLPTQAVAWKVRGKFKGTPAVAHQAVFVLSGGNAVATYDSITGRLLGSYTAPGETALQWQPIVTNDLVIAYSPTKTYLFDLKTRALRQTINYGGSVSLAGETLYIASGDNCVRAFGVPDPFNRAPVAQPIVTTTAEDQPSVVTLQAQDGDNDPLRYVISRLPSTGALYQTADGFTRGAAISVVPALVSDPAARVIYVPPQDSNGIALGSFGYRATDGKVQSVEAAVTVNVTAVNDAPVAATDQRFTQPGQILSPVRESLNDFDVDGDVLRVVAFTQPPAGRVLQNSDGTLQYRPPTGATSGSEDFTYTIEDPSGARSTGTVRVTVVPEVQGYWPTYGNGTDHTGYSSAMLARTGWAQRWSFQAGASPNPVVVADGKVFVSSNGTGSVVTALGEKTGLPIWSRTFANAYSTNPPTYYGGAVYFQRGNHSSDTQLISLDASTGATNWSSPHGAQWERYLAPAVSDLGAFINGGSYGGMYGFDRYSGTQRFFRSLPQFDSWTPSILGSELFSFVNGTFISHDPANGDTRWSLGLGADFFSYSMDRTAALQDRAAFFINNSPTATYCDEDLVCVNLDTHTTVWSINGEFTGTPAVSNRIVYALSSNTIQARAASDGRLLGTFTAPTAAILLNQPVITDEYVIAATATATYVFDRATRAIVTTIARGGFISVADDQLIIAAGDGTIAAYAAQPAITFSPAGGNLSQPTNVSLTAATAGGTIYYTMDGSAPNLESPTLLSGQSISIQWAQKIRAILVQGSTVSRIHEASFTLTDSDGDGLPDWWEMARFGALTRAGLATDSDGDGVTDKLELMAGTDPTNRADKFGVEPLVSTAGGGLQISWSSKADRVYVIEESHDLATWVPATSWVPGTGSTITRQMAKSGASGFYRVRAVPRPNP